MIADGMTPEQIAFAALEGFEPEILDSRAAEYRCDCSRDRMRRALVSLGQEELARMVEEGENIEVNWSLLRHNPGYSSRMRSVPLGRNKIRNIWKISCIKSDKRVDKESGI